MSNISSPMSHGASPQAREGLQTPSSLPSPTIPDPAPAPASQVPMLHAAQILKWPQQARCMVQSGQSCVVQMPDQPVQVPHCIPYPHSWTTYGTSSGHCTAGACSNHLGPMLQAVLKGIADPRAVRAGAICNMSSGAGTACGIVWLR